MKASELLSASPDAEIEIVHGELHLYESKPNIYSDFCGYKENDNNN